MKEVFLQTKIMVDKCIFRIKAVKTCETIQRTHINTNKRETLIISAMDNIHHNTTFKNIPKNNILVDGNDQHHKYYKIHKHGKFMNRIFLLILKICQI